MKPISQRPRSSLVGIFLLAAAAGTLLFFLLVPTWDHPWDPIESRDWGWRGIAMNTFTSARTRNDPINIVPAATTPFPDTGMSASEVYENVKVLGDLDSGQFDYLMQSMTEWVAPDQGCGYCHGDGGNFASDDLYTKKVARPMRAMSARPASLVTPATGATTCRRRPGTKGQNPSPRWAGSSANRRRGTGPRRTCAISSRVHLSKTTCWTTSRFPGRRHARYRVRPPTSPIWRTSIS